MCSIDGFHRLFFGLEGFRVVVDDDDDLGISCGTGGHECLEEVVVAPSENVLDKQCQFGGDLGSHCCYGCCLSSCWCVCCLVGAVNSSASQVLAKHHSTKLQISSN